MSSRRGSRGKPEGGLKTLSHSSGVAFCSAPADYAPEHKSGAFRYSTKFVDSRWRLDMLWPGHRRISKKKKNNEEGDE